MICIRKEIENLANKYSVILNKKINDRIKEMSDDNKDHYLIYRILGISSEEGNKIDLYQNKGRFLYKYAGSFLEEITNLCLNLKFPNGLKNKKIKNTLGSYPKNFEIDFLNENDAIEIKWRDATTDGDHITKEHTRIKVIKNYGYKPIRVMFYYPNRSQAIKIQETLKTLYKGLDGDYYISDEAWSFIKSYTDIDLKNILNDIANKKEK